MSVAQVAGVLTDENAFVADLMTLGAVVFVVRPGGSEFVWPEWGAFTAAGNADRLAKFRPALDGLCAVTGELFAVVDVDPRNGGDVAAARALLGGLAVRVFAETMTPGGGAHFYIAAHELLTAVSATEGRAGMLGYPGVDVQVGRKLVFLPGTSRPKYGGLGYVVVRDDLAALADGGDPDGAETFADWVASRRVGVREVFEPAPPWDGTPADQRETGYLAAVLKRQCVELAATPSGGRNARLFMAAMKLGSYVAGAGMVEQDVITALTEAATRNGSLADDGTGQVRATILSGLKAGRRNPRAVPPGRDSLTGELAPGASRTPTTGDDDATEGSQGDESALGDSWAPVDLSGVVEGLLSGSLARLSPTVARRDDGTPLLYAGKVNGIAGPPGCGKSWTAQHACVQELAAGAHVVYIDFEDDAAGVVGRLLDMGADPDAVVTRFNYVQPDQKHDDAARARLAAVIVERAPSLVVIDSTGESMALDGAKPNDDDDTARWFRSLPTAVARLGPAVLVLDHVVKADDGGLWPIGSQRKRAAISGAQYMQSVAREFSKDTAGLARLICAKDRHGHFRLKQKVAELVVTPDGVGGVGVILRAPGSDTAHSTPFRPTTLMERVSVALATAGQPLSGRGLDDRVIGKQEHVAQALSILVAEGYVSRTDGPRGAHLHTLVRAYVQAADPGSDSYDLAGDSRVQEATVSVSPLRGGGRETDTQPSPGDSRDTVGHGPTVSDSPGLGERAGRHAVQPLLSGAAAEPTQPHHTRPRQETS